MDTAHGGDHGTHGPSRRSRRLLTTATAGVLWFCFFGSGEAYRFHSKTGIGGDFVSSEDAARWTTAWGPGDTLAWTLDTSADWSRWFGSSAGARRVIEKALAAWSDIPNADISWELAGEAASDYGDRGPRDRTSGNWVSIDPNGEFNGQARYWWRRAGSVWRIAACTVVAGSWAAEEPWDSWYELPEDHPRRSHPGLPMWIHEFGHCLGLRHSQRLPTNWPEVRGEFDEQRGQYREYRVMQSEPWLADPMMSYGFSGSGLEHAVKADDAVGAALLRPARGWLRTVGAISGSLLREGRPVRYAYVWAFPAEAMPEGGQPGAVGGFSDRDGRFLIEGLAPGPYVLWVSPITERYAHDQLSGQAGPSVLDETVVPYPVQVRAGSVTEGITIPVRRGRECRAPAPCGTP